MSNRTAWGECSEHDVVEDIKYAIKLVREPPDFSVTDRQLRQAESWMRKRLQWHVDNDTDLAWLARTLLSTQQRPGRPKPTGAPSERYVA